VVTISCGGGSWILRTVLVYDGTAGADLELLGDPVAGRAIASIGPGLIITQEPAHGPDDPQCCPSQHRLTEWLLTEGSWPEGETLLLDADG
jgi:hypothetical protein